MHANVRTTTGTPRTTAPEGPLSHAWELGNVAYRGPTFAHVGWSLLFAGLGVHALAVAHLGFAAMSWATMRVHLAGRMVPAFVASLLISLLHVAADVGFLGWESGFHLFLIPVAIIAALSPGVGTRTRVALFGTTLAAHFVLYVAFGQASPAHPLPEELLRWMLPANLFGALAFTALWGQGLVKRLGAAEAQAAREQARSDALLANILPDEVATRLKRGDTDLARAHAEVSVVFVDLVGFTQLAARTAPSALVAMLDGLFTRMDALAATHGVEKIKTIGDAYMAAAGVPNACDDPTGNAAAFALAVLEAMRDEELKNGLRARVGIATGPVVAGVIGTTKFSYDVWGDTVNTAARMESSGVPGRVQIDAATRERLGEAWIVEARGTVEVKGKGDLQTWFLTGRRPQP